MKTGTKLTNWAGMVDDERYQELKKQTEVALVDGAFNASKNAGLNDAMKRFGIREQILDDLSVETSDKKRNHIASMTEKERLQWAVGYIKENMLDGVFTKRHHVNFCSIVTYYGVYKKAFGIAGAVKPDEAWRPALETLIKNLKPYKKDKITDCQTLNEAAAMIDLLDAPARNSRSAKEKSRNSLVKHLVSTFPLHEDVALSELTESKLIALLTNKWNAPVNTKKLMLRFINTEILRPVFTAGMYTPCVAKFGDGKYITEYVEAATKKIVEPTTLMEYCIVNWPKKVFAKYATLEFLRQYGNITLEEFKWRMVLNYTPERWTGKKSLSQWRVSFKKEFLLPLQEKGLLLKSFFSITSLDGLYEKHRQKKGSIAKEERTVMWYAFEHHSDISMDSESFKKNGFLQRFYGFEEVKAIEFTAEHFQEMKNNYGDGFIPIIHKMIEDGLCSHEVMTIEKEEVDFSYHDDVWSTRSGVFDFSLIDEVFREPSKVYVQERTKKCTQRMSAWRDLLELWKILAHLGVNHLKELDNNKKKLFYMSLGKMVGEGPEQHVKAWRVLKVFRSLIKNLKAIRYDGLNTSLIVANGEFTVPSIPKEIVTYTEDEAQAIVDFLQLDPNDADYQKIVDKYNISRLEICAFGLLALTARRIGEVTQANSADSTGLRIDDLIKVGVGEECAMKYYSPKHKAEEMVYIGDLVGYRKDPIAKILEGMLPKLFAEAISITQLYRKALPKELQNLLLVEKKNGYRGVAFGVIRSDVLRRKMKSIFKEIGVDPSRTPHEFRHYQATQLILSGGTIMDAADALQDAPMTVARNYHKFADRIDTLKLMTSLGRTQMVNALEDSEYLKTLDKNESKVCFPEKMSEDNHRMAGGECSAGAEKMFECPSFQMMRGAKGCPGCRYLEVNCVDNKAYWEAEMRAALKGLDKSKSGSMQWTLYEIARKKAKVILDDIKEKEFEYECGLH